MISCGMCCGERVAAAISLVARSTATTRTSVPQNRGGLGLPLSIFFALFAFDAIPGVRQRVETLEADVFSAIVAFAELLRISIKSAQRFIYVPEKPPFLAGKQECLLSLHGVSTLVRHMKRVSAQITVGPLRRGPECLVVVAELLEDALSFFKQALLKMLQALFRHRLRFRLFVFAAGCCCHFLNNPLQGDFNVLPIKVERLRRVCSFDSIANYNLDGEYFISDPLLERFCRFLNFCAAADEKRDAITYGEIQFLPQPL